MPLPLDTRKKPADVEIHVTSGAGMDITWADGHQSHYDFPYLRDLCPCALCDEERRKDAALSGPGAAPLGPVLPMYKPKAKAKSAVAVGSYAIQIHFSDGHSTGIYSYDYLRTICPCEACKLEFRSTPQ
ncbi:MAG: DUF971 domain-containing protein [Acidobacteria bacterium]|nr:DUF971 domain-containing protein [Acidobacteriota bacterium]